MPLRCRGSFFHVLGPANDYPDRPWRQAECVVAKLKPNIKGELVDAARAICL